MSLSPRPWCSLAVKGLKPCRLRVRWRLWNLALALTRGMPPFRYRLSPCALKIFIFTCLLPTPPTCSPTSHAVISLSPFFTFLSLSPLSIPHTPLFSLPSSPPSSSALSFSRFLLCALCSSVRSLCLCCRTCFRSRAASNCFLCTQTHRLRLRERGVREGNERSRREWRSEPLRASITGAQCTERVSKEGRPSQSRRSKHECSSYRFSVSSLGFEREWVISGVSEERGLRRGERGDMPVC